eukprot:746751-Hanusia_phi.AAC.4
MKEHCDALGYGGFPPLRCLLCMGGIDLREQVRKEGAAQGAEGDGGRSRAQRGDERRRGRELERSVRGRGGGRKRRSNLTSPSACRATYSPEESTASLPLLVASWTFWVRGDCVWTSAGLHSASCCFSRLMCWKVSGPGRGRPHDRHGVRGGGDLSTYDRPGSLPDGEG